MWSLLGLACGRARAPVAMTTPVPETAPSERAAEVAPAATIPDLRFVDAQSGGVLFALAPDGTLRLGTQVLGVLGDDVVFRFASTIGAVTARLTADGHVVIAAVDGTDLATVNGEVGKLLRTFQGRIASAYVIDATGTATAPRVPPLSFDEQGKLVGTALSVPGLTARHRRTAMFVYVLLTMLIV